MNSQINMFDLAVLAILSLSAVIAFFRGFVRELFALGAWVGATIITIYAFPHSTEFMKHHMKNPNLAAGVGSLGTFIAALLFISVVNSILLRYMKTGTEVGLLDNFLGLMFGLVRGAFILSLGYLILAQFLPKNPEPKWLETSFTKEYLQQSSDALVKAAPHYLNDIEGLVRKEEAAIKEEKNTTADTGAAPYQHGTGQAFDQLLHSSGPTNAAQQHY